MNFTSPILEDIGNNVKCRTLVGIGGIFFNGLWVIKVMKDQDRRFHRCCSMLEKDRNSSRNLSKKGTVWVVLGKQTEYLESLRF
jgi:hypothetical protein